LFLPIHAPRRAAVGVLRGNSNHLLGMQVSPANNNLFIIVTAPEANLESLSSIANPICIPDHLVAPC
jgi:hypothetical protein